jgi:hypothetical protein
VLPYIIYEAINAKVKAVQLQERAELVRALNTIHHWRGIEENLSPINGVEVGKIVVLTELMSKESSKGSEINSRGEW